MGTIRDILSSNIPTYSAPRASDCIRKERNTHCDAQQHIDKNSVCNAGCSIAEV